MSDSMSAEEYVDPADSEIPPWSRLTAPVLQTMTDGEVRRRRDIVSAARKLSGVSEAGMAETLNSGDLRINNRLNWAVQHLSKAELVEVVSRGRYRITDAVDPGSGSIRQFRHDCPRGQRHCLPAEGVVLDSLCGNCPQC